ncbi:hypothetical protein FIU94_16020 [Sulfitobacter sp. THAF37]|uniref:DUF4177 domain-containing protein n=1 Tax=Sulfitobacter sp. THAF37 TaxID=2587855 RepID=UPI001269678F|nr:DUF4177 domain-containing protein [Sulfitobacter sp. THAF37]QFT60336.1 hypothetical protein FIU94_16020 [Sulfitobacter sp. THAF37]
MPRYEYKVVPAPSKGRKGKGVKGAEARFSYGLQELMNELAGDGWEYQRAETLPSVERSGLTSTTTEWRNVLVFRRLREGDAEAFAPELLPAPDEASAPSETPEDLPEAPAEDLAAQTPADTTDRTAQSIDDEDNGVEDTSDIKTVGNSLGKRAEFKNPPQPTD